MIDGVRITQLRQIEDERGKVMHMLRCDSDVFTSFGEIYFSCVKSGVVKAWKLHQHMILNFAVPYGKVKVVLYDSRPESPTKGLIQEIILGTDNYCLLTIPPRVWNGFQGIDGSEAILANCASIPHDPAEALRLEPNDPQIPYQWE